MTNKDDILVQSIKLAILILAITSLFACGRLGELTLPPAKVDNSMGY